MDVTKNTLSPCQASCDLPVRPKLWERCLNTPISPTLYVFMPMTKTAINPSTVFNSLQYGFSQGLVVTGQRRLMLSGQVGVDASERTVAGGMREQTEAALDNIELVLDDAGGTIDQVIMLRIFIREDASSQQEQEDIAAALLKRFPTNPPPSSWILISGLAKPEWLIEIEAEAMLD